MKLHIPFINGIKNRVLGEGDRKKIISNVFWISSDNILRMFVTLIVGVWVARYLKPEGYGILNYAIAYVAIFSAIAQLGVESLVIREVVKHPDKKNDILGTTFFLRIIIGIIAIISALIIISFIKPDDSLTFWLILIILLGFLFQPFDVIDLYFQSQIMSKYVVYARNAAFLIVNLLKIILLLLHADLIMFGMTYLLEIILGSLFIVITYQKRQNKILHWKFNYNLAKKLLLDVWPLLYSSMMIILYMRIDQVMIGSMLGNKDVGIYSAAVRIAELWIFVPNAIINSVFPAIIQAKETDKDKYLPRIKSLYSIMLWLGIIAGLGTMILSKPIVLILLGKNYLECTSILTISIWSGLFALQGVVRAKWLIIENLQKYISIFVTFGAVVNILLNLVLIPIYRSQGAAIASLLAQVIVTVIMPLLFKDTRMSAIMSIKSIIPDRSLLLMFKK